MEKKLSKEEMERRNCFGCHWMRFSFGGYGKLFTCENPEGKPMANGDGNKECSGKVK